MKIRYSLFISLLLLTFGHAQKEMMAADTIRISKTSDFEVSGDGTSDNWKMARWVDIKQRAYATISMQTKVKVLYSDTGVYFLYFNKDRKLNASIKEDGKHLWTEDVVEVFLWPDTTKEIYFEYELSPLNYELPLMVINIDRKPHRWQAWYFEDDRKIIHKTTVQGGEKKEGALIESWMAEFFIPYTLLSSIGGKPPVQGEAWRVNFNRVDYLDEKEIYWSWQDLPGSFHDINRFGTMIFE
ncbi:MAG: carbohydrate-binding family 9-like protein [Flavobacteriaceae bacterium]